MLVFLVDFFKHDRLAGLPINCHIQYVSSQSQSSGIRNINAVNTYKIFSIPLFVEYSFLLNKKWSLGIDAGAFGLRGRSRDRLQTAAGLMPLRSGGLAQPLRGFLPVLFTRNVQATKLDAGGKLAAWILDIRGDNAGALGGEGRRCRRSLSPGGTGDHDDLVCAAEWAGGHTVTTFGGRL